MSKKKEFVWELSNTQTQKSVTECDAYIIFPDKKQYKLTESSTKLTDCDRLSFLTGLVALVSGIKHSSNTDLLFDCINNIREEILDGKEFQDCTLSISWDSNKLPLEIPVHAFVSIITTLALHLYNTLAGNENLEEGDNGT